MAVGAGVLVTLDQDGVAAQDQQAGGRVGGEITRDVALLAVMGIGDGRFRRGIAEGRGRGGRRDAARGVELVEMAEPPDQRAHRPAAGGLADGITRGLAVSIGIGAVIGE